MLKITLLKTLYYELDPSKISTVTELIGKDRRYHTFEYTYPVCPAISSVTAEERFLPYSVLYYVWVNDEKKTADLNDLSLCQWIFSFFKEHCPNYLLQTAKPEHVQNLESLLSCFDVDQIPSYQHKYAYSDLTYTTMEDIRNGTDKKDTRNATFPGITFASKYKKE